MAKVSRKGSAVSASLQQSATQAAFSHASSRSSDGQPATQTDQAPGVAEVNDFLRLFCAALLSLGAQTARVDRNAARIAGAFGCAVDLAVFPKHLMLSVTSLDGRERRTSVGSIDAGVPDFRKVAGLNALGWSIVDECLSLEEARRRFHAILCGQSYHPACVRLMAACANAAFCRLFEGDATAMALVFAATLGAFYLRQLLVRWRVDGKIVFFCCAFSASMLAAPGVLFHWGSTPQTALATSVLFLIPGIPLINAMLDIMDGHVLMGFSRMVQTSILIVCIALGLALTMALLGVNAL